MPSYKDAPEWKMTTPKERLFLEAYLEPEEGDPFDLIAATKAAFQAKDDETALNFGLSTLKRPRIEKIINFASPTGGLPTLEEFKREVWSTVKTSKDPKLKFDSLTLYADLEGWRVRGTQKPVRPKDATAGDAGGLGELNDLQYKEEGNN